MKRLDPLLLIALGNVKWMGAMGDKALLSTHHPTSLGEVSC
jgi:hypothetical protein